MKDMKANPFNREKLSENILKDWQRLLDDAADILDVPKEISGRECIA